MSDPIEYLFEAYRSTTMVSAETWALQIPAGELHPEDAGAFISIDGHPSTIADGYSRWDVLQNVSDHSFIRASVTLMIDGVSHVVGFDRKVWIGWNPDGPAHMQRGGFWRRPGHSVSDGEPFAELTGTFQCAVTNTVGVLDAFDALVADARAKIKADSNTRKVVPGDTFQANLHITGRT